MGLQFCSISSGSRGNCYVITTEKTVMLIDAGISGKKIFAGLEELGIVPEQVNGVLVTHEHTDHVKSIGMICRKSENAYIYANQATWEQIADEKWKDRHRVFITGETFQVRDLTITPFSVHHDAVDPVGFLIENEGRTLAVLTDTGYVCDNIYRCIRAADLLVIESNHEVNLLKVCKYPYRTKMRILGDHGHLSNEAAAECVAEILKSNKESIKFRTVLLAHLSKENNTPDMARLAMANILDERGLYEADLISIDVLTQDKQSYIYNV